MLALACVVILAAAGPWSLAEAAAERDEAFIGYSERAAECKDRLENCHGKAKHDGCVRDPYNMRTFCPISCGVSKCMSTGTLKVRHRGSATQEDTSAFSQRWTAGQLGLQGTGGAGGQRSHFRNLMLGGEKLQLSSLGVGTYLGGMDARTDDAVAAAVIYSVVSGWNVIDTASNYRWGHAESAIGAALDSLLAGASVRDFLQDGEYAADITRGMLFISTKAGFTDEALVRRLVKERALARREVVDGHCLAPAYLKASVAASLERLNLHTVDLVYLHNPAEMQLQGLGKAGFKAKMVEAFKALEDLRAAGQLRHYGVASWDCFRVPPTDAGHLSLEEVVSWAREAGGDKHGFAAIQLPVSAGMPEAWSQPWQVVANASVSVMKAAEQLGVAVFTSGPLGEGDLLKRLTSRLDGVMELRGQATTAQKLIQIARSTPGKSMASALVGHKTREFVMSNTAVATMEPLSEADFHSAMRAVRAIMSEGGAAAAGAEGGSGAGAAGSS